MNTGDGFLAGDAQWFHDQALNVVFPQLSAQPVEFGPRYFQVAGVFLLIVLMFVWIFVVRRRGIATSYFLVRLVIPTAGLLAVAYLFGVYLPTVFGIPLSGIGVFYPDIGLLLTLCAGLALIWAVVRAAFLVSAKLLR